MGKVPGLGLDHLPGSRRWPCHYLLVAPHMECWCARSRLMGHRRSFRLNRGLTVEQVAEQLLCSPSKVSRIETGQRGATLRDVRDLCRVYGVTDQAQVTHSMSNGNCAEVALVAGTVAIRDSKDPRGPVLRYSPDSWRSFLCEARTGTYDLFR
jgi:transcriptional regulator with XRE-family HTH domain